MQPPNGLLKASEIAFPGAAEGPAAPLAWLWREARMLLAWLREPALWAMTLAGVLLWAFAYQITPPQILHIGGDLKTRLRDLDRPFLQNSFNASEPADSSDRFWYDHPVPPYRWTTEQSTVLLPGIGGDRWTISVLAGSGRPDGSATLSYWQVGDGASIALRIDPRPQIYTIIGRATDGDLLLSITTPPYVTPKDPRSLGIVIREIRATPIRDSLLQIPPLTHLGLLAISQICCYGLARRLGLRRYWTLALALALAATGAITLIEHRLALTLFTPVLARLAAVCYVLAITLAPVLTRAARAFGLHAPPDEQHAALGTVIGGFALRMGGLLHPAADFSDLGLNVNNLIQVIRGAIFFTEGLPSEAGGGSAPYPPAQYLVLAPLRLLVSDDRHMLDLIIQGGNALLESSAAALIWLMLRRARLGGRAALLGAALYVVAPPILRSFSVGEFANLFAQSLLAPLLLFLTLDASHIHRWPVVALGSVLLAAILLSHTGMTISVLALLAAWTPLWWFSRPARPWRLVAGGGVALLVALALFYSSFTGLFEERRAAAAERLAPVAAETNECSVCLLPTKILGAVRYTFGVAGTLSPMLGVAGAGGALWLWQRRRPVRLDRMLLACWLGVLLSFVTLLNADQTVRWQHFLFPALCLGAGPMLAAWSRRGPAGIWLALALLGYLTWFGIDRWITQIVTYFH